MHDGSLGARLRGRAWSTDLSGGTAVLIAVAILIALLPTPVGAASAADLAIDLDVVDDTRDEHTVRVRITNLGPADSTYPIATVTVEGAAISGHDGDPVPGSRDDGVGCDLGTDGSELSCSWDVIASNSAQVIDVRVIVGQPATLSAQAVPAGTPDPNPHVNNRAAVSLQPAMADLVISDIQLDPATGTVQDPADPADPADATAARRLVMTVTIGHRAGREADVTLHVTPDSSVRLTAPCRPGDGRAWSCPAGRLGPGGQVTLTTELDRPEPGEDPLELALLASAAGLTDPDPQAATARVGIQPRSPIPGQLVRHAGADRLGTAIAISQARFSADGAGAVVLARADTYADALAGGPLAADVDGPLLLTPSGALSSATAAEIDRVLRHGSTVHLLGGTAALSDEVAQAVRASGYQVNRIAGPNRYATAVAVWDALGRPRRVAAADGDTHPDAVVAGAAMAASGGALLLTAGDRVPPELVPLAAQVDHAIGRPAARALPGATALHGTTPAGTAVAVARTYFAAPDAVGLATAAQFPDALAGGPLTASLAAPLLLSDGDRLSPEVADYLSETSSITAAHLLGGPAALSLDVEDQVADRIAR